VYNYCYSLLVFTSDAIPCPCHGGKVLLLMFDIQVLLNTTTFHIFKYVLISGLQSAFNS